MDFTKEGKRQVLLDCAPLTGILNKKLSGTETTDWQSFDILNVRPPKGFRRPGISSDESESRENLI